MTTEEMLNAIRDFVSTLESRTVISEASLGHLREIYTLCFIEWYDPDNEETAKLAKKIWPHILAINKELKFRT